MFGLKIVQVKEQSMEPTLKENDFILIKTHFNKVSLKKNDLIIVKSPIEKKINLVKRIVGEPDDFIQIYSNSQVMVNKNIQNTHNVSIDDEWIEYEWQLGNNEYIVLSDNHRVQTKDSRYFGPIKFENIVGKVIFKIKPFSRIK